MNDDFQILYLQCFQMLNMEWEKQLQYICGKCWQHIWEFHQFQQAVIEAQKGLHLNKEAAKEVGEVVTVKSEMNIKKEQQEWHSGQEFIASTEDLIKPTPLTFDIKTEEPLSLNSDYEGMSSPGLDQLTDGEMSLMSHMSSRTENTSLTYDNESNEECMPCSSLGQTNPSFSNKKLPVTKKSVEEFDELVALWRSSLECEICHQLKASYSQLKEHFSKNHTSEGCYLMCCQLRLETRYDIENHIRYHNAPQQLKCVACCKVYRLEEHLRAHKRKVHTSKGEDKNAKDGEKLEVGKYRCSKCLKDFATKSRLNNHSRDVHKPKIFECHICEKSFMHPNALREHLAAHTGDKAHACSFCPMAFTCRAYYRRHMRKHHLQEWNNIQNEGAQKETLDGYRRETRGECMVYICHYCSREYDKKYSMLNHLNQCQRDGRPVEPNMGFRLETRGESLMYVCIYCSKECEKRISMLNHIRGCQRDDGPIEFKSGYRRETRGESMVYVCVFCSKEYDKRPSMYTHLRQCQIEYGQIGPKLGYRLETRGESMVYICIYCSKEYEKPQSMRSHLYRCHRDDGSLAKQQVSIASEPLAPAPQQQGSSKNDESNTTPDGDILNVVGQEAVGEEDSLMTPIEEKELKDETATRTNVKTEQFSDDTNALVFEEMDEREIPLEFEDATFKSEEFIEPEEEFIEL
ncbi:zinc finger protein Xfin-like [Stomoxys calcitrans]|uniref:zinc finger protein Xfin-like n=1 Tax=Stomoxys calcitrans TaxID=35570 RepID=UPI0027E34091|nr:zinc finger protein Xfin-like [Stomoxys calcitrans]